MYTKVGIEQHTVKASDYIDDYIHEQNTASVKLLLLQGSFIHSKKTRVRVFAY